MNIFKKNNDSHNMPPQSKSGLLSPLATAKDNMLSRYALDSGRMVAQTFANVVNSGKTVAAFVAPENVRSMPFTLKSKLIGILYA